MKIVIAGAGDMGFHLAELLVSEKQEIILIDTNEDVLDYVKQRLDVYTVRGDSSSIEVLENAMVSSAKMFLAVTASEKNNLVSSILAKKMGAKQTIARVHNSEYLCDTQRSNFLELGIDHLISPVELAATEIERLVKHCEVTDNFEFEDGKVILNGITLDDSSGLVGQSIGMVSEGQSGHAFKPVAILRNNEETIVPREHTVMHSGDHVYFMTTQDEMNPLLTYLGKELKKVKNVMILGGTPLGIKTAQLLERKYNVTIVAQTKEQCRVLSELLDSTLIIKADPSNIEVLRDEGLDRMDSVIALTENTETNIIACLSAEKYGVYKTIAAVNNAEYTHISQHIGIDTLINKKLIAANNIFRFVRKGKVEAITSLPGVEAEIIEYVIQKNNQLTRKPLSKLPLPTNAMIAAVVREEQSILPQDDFQLALDDKVIVVAADKCIAKVDSLFR
ncbi:MAG: Trk system potassium transporter TrkA [Bacteroidota bacterium]